MKTAEEFLKDQNTEDMIMGFDSDGEFVLASDLMTKYYQEQSNIKSVKDFNKGYEKGIKNTLKIANDVDKLFDNK